VQFYYFYFASFCFVFWMFKQALISQYFALTLTKFNSTLMFCRTTLNVVTLQIRYQICGNVKKELKSKCSNWYTLYVVSTRIIVTIWNNNWCRLLYDKILMNLIHEVLRVFPFLFSNKYYYTNSKNINNC